MRERFSTRIIVKELRPIKTGTTGGGTAYTISQVIATKPDGVPIGDFNLRTFDDLPTNTVIEVDCELFKSERFGDSYTVKLKSGQQQSGLAKALEDLRTRVERIEHFLQGRGEFVGTAAPEPTQAPPPPPTTSGGPPPPPDIGGAGAPPQTDIPF